MSVLTSTLVVGSAVVGLVSARWIVSESDAHRRTGGDAWWAPTCEVCGGGLGPFMHRCVEEAHPQRATNLVVLATTVALFAIMPLVVDSNWLLPAFLTFAFFSILLTVTDLDTKLLPNRILLPASIVGIVLLLLGSIPEGSVTDVGRGVVAGACYFGVMLILALIARGALGMGDVKLAFYLGLFTGFVGWWYVAITGVGGFLIGGVVSILLLALRRVSRKDSIPFGPFMVAGAFMALIFGDAIIAWYVG
jgi:leader peptidase (prepilin peptidase) / N-methyltransferase